MSKNTDKPWEDLTVQELENLIAYRHSRIAMLKRQIDQIEEIIDNKKI